MSIRAALVAVIATVALFGCSPKYYAPNTHNIPLLQQKGDASVGGFVGDGRVEVQGSYALSDNVGALISGAFYRPADDEDGDGGSGDFVEGGLGYFMPVGASFGFETYALLGLGSLENHFPSTLNASPTTTGVLESQVVRFGGQTAFGFRSNFFEAALSVRVTSLNYQDVTGSLVFNSEDQVAFLQQNDSYTLFEPALTLRAGPERFKIQMQLGITENMTSSDLDQDEGHLTLGLIVYPFRNAPGN